MDRQQERRKLSTKCTYMYIRNNKKIQSRISTKLTTEKNRRITLQDIIPKHATEEKLVIIKKNT